MVSSTSTTSSLVTFAPTVVRRCTEFYDRIWKDANGSTHCGMVSFFQIRVECKKIDHESWGLPAVVFWGATIVPKNNLMSFQFHQCQYVYILSRWGRGRRMMGNLWWNDTGCIYTYLYVLITSLSSDSFGSQWLTPLSSSFYWFFASYLEKFTSEAGLLKLPKTIWESWLFHTFVIVYNGGIFGIFGILQQL